MSLTLIPEYEWDAATRERYPVESYRCDDCGGDAEQCDDQWVCPRCDPDRYEHKCPECGACEMSDGEAQIGGDGYGARCCGVADVPVQRSCFACDYVEPWADHPENRRTA